MHEKDSRSRYQWVLGAESTRRGVGKQTGGRDTVIALARRGKAQAPASNCPEASDLPLTGRNIHLLELLPSTAADTLRCRLIPAHLDHDADFEALSYVWGAPVFSIKFSCNENPHFITWGCLAPRTAIAPSCTASASRSFANSTNDDFSKSLCRGPDGYSSKTYGKVEVDLRETGADLRRTGQGTGYPRIF